MSDLDKLIAAVEAGRCMTPFDFSDGFGPSASAQHCNDGWAAHNGDLNAALRLHEALLPGWDYCIDFVQRVDPLVYVQDDGGPTFDAEAKTPARAWLLAIHRALKARGEA